MYWTAKKVCVKAENLEGLCHVVTKSKITEKEPFLWSQKGLFKFYYDELFNIESKLLEPLNEEALSYESPPDSVLDLPTLNKPLKMLDVFAGMIFHYGYSGVPNKRTARLLILGSFSSTSRLLGST